MSIQISIQIPDADVSVVTLRRHMAALGYVQHSHPGEVPEEVLTCEFPASEEEAATEILATVEEVEAAIADVRASIAAEEAPAAPAKRTRRTKAEIAADNAALAAPAPAEKVVEVLEQAAVAEERAISTSPEDRKQDEADEKDESTDELTIDRVRALAGAYVEKFGMAAANLDGVTILTAALGPVPAGLTDTAGKPVEKWRLSVIPEDQASLVKVIHAWEEAIETNPFDRTVQ